MLSGRGDAPAGWPLERASPWKLQPTAMVRVSRRLLAAKLALKRSATPQSLRPKPLSLAKVRVALARFRSPLLPAARASRHGSHALP